MLSCSPRWLISGACAAPAADGATMFDHLGAVDPRFVHEGERNRHIAFPLGGIGSGGFRHLRLRPAGRLVDRQSARACSSFNGYSHFAIKAERDGKLLDARAQRLPMRATPPARPACARNSTASATAPTGQVLGGLPHFAMSASRGRFPTADLGLADTRFPGDVRLTRAFALHPAQRPRQLDARRHVRHRDRATRPTRRLISRLRVRSGNYRCSNGEHRYAQWRAALCTPAPTTEPARGADLGDVDHRDRCRPTSSMWTITIAASGSTI